MQQCIVAQRLLLLILFILGIGGTSNGATTQAAPLERNPSIYLPLVTAPPTLAQEAIERLNWHRTLAQAPLIQPHAALLRSATNHAIYTVINDGDRSAFVNGPHGEVVGKPAFTGVTAADRMVAAQFPYTPRAEVMAYLADPIRSVDGLMATVYHRVIMLDPSSTQVGYGQAHSTSRAADVLDFGSDARAATDRPDIVVYPGPEQLDVPLYSQSESPSPLPPGASYPAGYPITIQPRAGAALTVTQAELRDSSGSLIATHPNPPNCGSVCYALIPTTRLRPATTYMVYLVGDVDGVAFDRAWSFTTRLCATPLEC